MFRFFLYLKLLYIFVFWKSYWTTSFCGNIFCHRLHFIKYCYNALRSAYNKNDVSATCCDACINLSDEWLKRLVFTKPPYKARYGTRPVFTWCASESVGSGINSPQTPHTWGGVCLPPQTRVPVGIASSGFLSVQRWSVRQACHVSGSVLPDLKRLLFTSDLELFIFRYGLVYIVTGV